ncbi:MAG: hypothetical protein HY664_06940 [Chloroflexi bacterium]|nr:hypothetical protein [Chloroflexota bacterium]
MNLIDLYARTPAEGHGNIVVSEGKVYVRSPEGTEEYILKVSGEVELVHSDKDIRAALSVIKAKLGIV